MGEDAPDIKYRLKEHYDRDARAYHEVHYVRKTPYSPLKYRQQYIEELIAAAGVRAGDTILDVGCGPGELLLSLLRKGFDARGVDISPGMVEEARALLAVNGFTADRVSLGDIERIGFPDASFNVLVAAGVIEYQRRDDEALAEMARVLKPGGLLLLNVSIRGTYVAILDDAYRWLKKRRGPRRALQFVKQRLFGRGELHDLPDRRTHWPSAFDAALAKVGLVPVERRYFHFSLLPMPLDSVIRGISGQAGRRLEARFSAHSVGRYLAGGYLVAAMRHPPKGAHH